MKITAIKTKLVDLEFIKPIVVTFGTISSVKTVIVKIETDCEIYGYGEASGFGPVTGENVDTVLSVIKGFENVLIGQNPIEITKIHDMMNKMIANNTAAKAGIDIALYDIFAKTMGMPLYKVLGGQSNTYESDKTVSIGTIEEMIADTKANMADGFTKVKLKAGVDVVKDVAAFKAIRKECGDDLVIRMDANQGWTVIESIKAINEMEPYGLDAIEQPTPYWDFESLRKIREKINVPLMADESLHNEMDAIKLIKTDAVDLFNIKLMKSSGIFGAIKISDIGEAAGIQCMIGCMGESIIGITAGAHLAAAKNNINRIDLDVPFAIKEVACIKGGVKYVGGIATLPESPGLGIEVDF